ncbi:interleukin-31 receptor subunit alpha-like [Heptranchias perlo]|uniref:interleukin-31 receptor subunit alpha-like n=1 Tax=Heptranchias perlo TaxID=212740 RepID=UPI00355A5AE6
MSGERHVELQWQLPNEPDVGVASYNLTFQTVLKKISFTQHLHNTSSYQTAISLAPYNISIVAYNRVGTSLVETISIPPARPKEMPPLNITVVNNRTLKASWQPTTFECYCVVLELVSVGTILTNTCHSKNKLEIKKKGMLQKVFEGLEPFQRYRVMIHTKDPGERIGCHSVRGYTIGLATACTQEQPPTCGPNNINVTNIRKSSVFLEWKAIVLGDCQGVLQKYLIYYTDIRNHTHIAAVNSSTRCYSLINLNSSTLYTLEICGVSSAGPGPKTLRLFQTKDYDPSELTAIVVATSISVMVAVFIIASVCYLSIKRSKRIICPTIPDPVNSLAVKSMHSCVNINQWMTTCDDKDVTDVLIVMVSVQSDSNIPSPDDNAEDGMMSMTEDVIHCGNGSSFSCDSRLPFEYRRQMGVPLGMEGDQCSEIELNQQLEIGGPELVNNDVPPLCLQPHVGSALNLLWEHDFTSGRV